MPRIDYRSTYSHLSRCKMKTKIDENRLKREGRKRGKSLIHSLAFILLFSPHNKRNKVDEDATRRRNYYYITNRRSTMKNKKITNSIMESRFEMCCVQREKRKIGEEIERGHDCGKERGSATKKGKRETLNSKMGRRREKRRRRRLLEGARRRCGQDCAKARLTLISVIVSCAIMLPLKSRLYSLLTYACLRRY